MPRSAPTTTPSRRTPGPWQWRWFGVAIGLLGGFGDAFLLASVFGVDFRVNTRDATLAVGIYFGVTFAVLGYLLGSAVEARRRDRHAAELLEAQGRTIAATRARLLQSEKLAALGELAAAIAHEVRNPLGVMRSAAQSVAEGLPDSDVEARRACSFITAETDRLNSVVNSLLAFAKPIRPRPSAAAVGDLFDTALALAGPELAAKGISVVRADSAALPTVEADRDLLTQVLVDLLANAAAATPAGGEVTLEARAADGSVEIAVADCGPGVPAELRTRVFEPFFTTRREGTGLGLAIARQIVVAHGGRIDVGERDGGGARFTVSLPGTREAAAAA